MNKGRQKRVEKPSSGQAEAYGIDNQSTVEVLQDDPAAVARDANGIDDFGQVVANQNDVGAFPGDIVPAPIATPTLSLAECLCIIDAVSQHSDRPTFFTCSAMKAVFYSGRSSE